MQYLSLSDAPPSSKAIEAAFSNKVTETEAPSIAAEKGSRLDITADPNESPTPANEYPVVRLDVDTISDAAAARLATSLLGHVLFLKNQVPFPVMQLGRIPGGKANSRAYKQRTELLASYDTISSHLDTTFSALSTALARCSSPPKVARAHVAILVGPSLTTAKAKVMLGIHGIETRVWGARDDAVLKSHPEDSTSEGSADEEDDERCLENESEDSGEEPEESDDDDEEEEEEEEEEESGDDEDEDENGDSECEHEQDEAEQEDVSKTPSSPPPPYVSYAEEQRFLQNADRLLSRTLAAADAEGNGISSEMSPTQTHVLIRAPRRFNHPAWLPRQNVSSALDISLQEFMDKSGLGTSPADNEGNRSRMAKKVRLEGVWITRRSGLYETASPEEKDVPNRVEPGAATDNVDDEMIWWSWDGKFVGFNDW